MADLGTLIIPYVIGNIFIKEILLDLGINMNVLPEYFYNIFQLGEFKVTPMTIQLANRSIKISRGILENVILKVQDFIFLVDFIMLNMEGVDA